MKKSILFLSCFLFHGVLWAQVGIYKIEGDLEVTGDAQLDGKLGLGTATPTYNFHMAATSPAIQLIESTSTDVAYSGAWTYYKAPTNDPNKSITAIGHSFAGSADSGQFVVAQRNGTGGHVANLLVYNYDLDQWTFRPKNIVSFKITSDQITAAKELHALEGLEVTNGLTTDTISFGSGGTASSATFLNPNNSNAQLSFEWENDEAKFTVGGTGAGSDQGVTFYADNDVPMMRLVESGDGEAYFPGENLYLGHATGQYTDWDHYSLRIGTLDTGNGTSKMYFDAFRYNTKFLWRNKRSGGNIEKKMLLELDNSLTLFIDQNNGAADDQGVYLNPNQGTVSYVSRSDFAIGRTTAEANLHVEGDAKFESDIILKGKLQATDGVVLEGGGDAVAGAVRWTGTDFEGHNGTEWQSFTTPPNTVNGDISMGEFQ